MNQTLEAMASAIFQDWFVDFGPVRAKNPTYRRNCGTSSPMNWWTRNWVRYLRGGKLANWERLSKYSTGSEFHSIVGNDHNAKAHTHTTVLQESWTTSTISYSTVYSYLLAKMALL